MGRRWRLQKKCFRVEFVIIRKGILSIIVSSPVLWDFVLSVMLDNYEWTFIVSPIIASDV